MMFPDSFTRQIETPPISELITANAVLSQKVKHHLHSSEYVDGFDFEENGIVQTEIIDENDDKDSIYGVEFENENKAPEVERRSFKLAMHRQSEQNGHRETSAPSRL